MIRTDLYSLQMCAPSRSIGPPTGALSPVLLRHSIFPYAGVSIVHTSFCIGSLLR